jgi:hypothetical protein
VNPQHSLQRHHLRRCGSNSWPIRTTTGHSHRSLHFQSRDSSRYVKGSSRPFQHFERRDSHHSPTGFPKLLQHFQCGECGCYPSLMSRTIPSLPKRQCQQLPCLIPKQIPVLSDARFADHKVGLIDTPRSDAGDCIHNSSLGITAFVATGTSDGGSADLTPLAT